MGNAMALYRVEALKRNALGLHETVDFHEFDAPDPPAALPLPTHGCGQRVSTKPQPPTRGL
jgi:hypothetical protein